VVVKVESYCAKWVPNKAFPDLSALFTLTAACGQNTRITICNKKDLPDGFIGAIGCRCNLQCVD